MKTRINRLQRSTFNVGRSTLNVLLIALIGLAIWLALAPPALAQVASTTTVAFDNVPGAMPGSSTSNVISSPVTVHQGKGLAILPYYKGGDVGVGSLVLKFNLTADGTNWTTTTPLACTNALNGTNVVRDYSLFTPLQLDNVQAIRLQTIQNTATNAATVTNIVASVGSGG
jgi:hypothetical protein